MAKVFLVTKFRDDWFRFGKRKSRNRFEAARPVGDYREALPHRMDMDMFIMRTEVIGYG